MSEVVGGGGEAEALEALAAALPAPEAGEVWFGDDAAVLAGEAGPLLLATDLVVEGVHFDRQLSSLADVGWKSLAANVSDMAAMGGRPRRAVVGVAGLFAGALDALYGGLLEAAAAFSCPIVGGDLSAAALGGGAVISIAVLGSTEGRPAVLRSGARAGDRLYLTGPLGASAAGLRMLRGGEGAVASCVLAHRRPVPRLAEGVAAARCGASAMIDISDGLGIDLDRLARACGLGVELESVPVAPGATRDEALGGGEDYELLIVAPPSVDLAAAFVGAGLSAPLAIGTLVADAGVRTLAGAPLPAVGYLHGASAGATQTSASAR
ncbi:MAG: thiamine-phosphate kinase [Actinomycetota bacterium]|nr:thiamine-phosphate kinase [Actinomycetota bacterium]